MKVTFGVFVDLKQSEESFEFEIEEDLEPGLLPAVGQFWSFNFPGSGEGILGQAAEVHAISCNRTTGQATYIYVELKALVIDNHKDNWLEQIKLLPNWKILQN